MAANIEELLNTQAKRPLAGRHELLKTLISLASLLLAIILAFANKDMPLWALALALLVVTFLLGFIAWTPAAWLHGKVSAWRARNRTAKALYPDIAQMMRRLERQLSDSYTNNLIYELRNLSEIREKNGQSVAGEINEFNRIAEWLRLFHAKVANRRKAAFPDVARAMNVAASQYWWMCYGIQNRLQGILARGTLGEQESKKVVNAWNSGRESANRFFVEWADLSDKINAELREHVGSADRSSLKTIG